MTNVLEMIDYMDELANQIDLRAENAFLELERVEIEGYLNGYYRKYIDQAELDRLRKFINERRKLFIDEIESVKSYNLAHRECDSENENMFKKHCFYHTMIFDKNFSLNRLEKNIQNVCARMFGYLIVVDEQLSNRKIQLFTELLKFCHIDDDETTQSEETDESDNRTNNPKLDDYNDSEVSVNQRLQELGFVNNCIFNWNNEYINDEKNFSEYDDDHNYVRPRIWLKLFNKAQNGIVIATNESELFTVIRLEMFSQSVQSIKKEALQLFFKAPISIQFQLKPLDARNLDNICLKWFQTHLTTTNNSLKLEAWCENIDFSDLKALTEIDMTFVDFPPVKPNINNRKYVNQIRFDYYSRVVIKNLPNLKNLRVDAGDVLFKLRLAYKLDTKTLPNLQKCSLVHILKRNMRSFNNLPNLTYLRLWLFRDLDDDETKFCVKPMYNLTNLKHLELSYQNIYKLDSNALKNLKCLKYLNLTGNQLMRIKKSNFNDLTSLEELFISKNYLTTIDSDAFKQLSNLVTLCLDDNQLDRIDPRWFETTLNLKTLKIDKNCITSIVSNTFVSLRALENMKIGDSYRYELLANIEPNAFRGLNSLKKLTINQNIIKHLDEGVFAGLASLETLYFDCETLMSSHPRAFEDLTHLEELSVKNGQLNNIASNMLINDLKSKSSLGNLKKMNLICNNLTKLDIQFVGLVNLTHLDLSENKICDIHSNTFDDLKNLITLDLRNNQIEQLPHGLFKNLNRLRRLLLWNNKINTLNANTFDGLENLVDMSLGNNHFQNIDEKWFEKLTNLKVLVLNHYGRIPDTLKKLSPKY